MKQKKLTNKERQDAMVDEVYAKTVQEQMGEDAEIVVSEEEQKKATATAAVAEGQSEEDLRIAYLHRFYTPMKDKQGNNKISIDNLTICEILMERGFYRYDLPDGSMQFVHVHNGRIEQLKSKNQKEFKDAFEDYVRSLPVRTYVFPGGEKWEITGDYILKQMYKQLGYYFSNFDRLRPEHPITIMQDTLKSKYFYYRNCVVRITAKGREIWNYKDLHKNLVAAGENNGEYIWEDSILDRDYTEDSSTGDFEQFCWYICGKDGQESDLFGKRLQSLMSIFGYLTHNNYECNLKSILFIDVNKKHSGRATGGTGKGIIGQALNSILNRGEGDCKYISVGGKSFNPLNEHRYSTGDMSTQMVHIEDIADSFNFKDFFNDVTDGATFKRLFVDKSKHKAKFMLSSNVALDTLDESVKRRLVIFELDNFFSARRTPVDVFGHRFFESAWSAKDWSQFDNFMIRCAELYMGTKNLRERTADGKEREIGIMEPPLINYKQTLLKAKLSEDFVNWFKDRIERDVLLMAEVGYEKVSLYEEFSNKYEEYKNREKYARAFTKWCKFYLQVMEIPSGEKRSTKDLLILYPSGNDPKVEMIFEG